MPGSHGSRVSSDLSLTLGQITPLCVHTLGQTTPLCSHALGQTTPLCTHTLGQTTPLCTHTLGQTTPLCAHSPRQGYEPLPSALTLVHPLQDYRPSPTYSLFHSLGAMSPSPSVHLLVQGPSHVGTTYCGPLVGSLYGPMWSLLWVPAWSHICGSLRGPDVVPMWLWLCCTGENHHKRAAAC